MAGHRILKLDVQGTPDKWIDYEQAITYHAKGLVAWQLGDENHTRFRGGENRITGQISQISSAPIIAVRGEGAGKRANRVPTLTNPELFARDRHTCAYCGRTFSEHRLTRDHIIPVSRGGKDIWTNVVTACDYDNHKKDDHLLQEIGMELLYVPYTPNRAESLILKGRKILPVQAEYLAQFIPESSRAHSILNELMNVH
jgi:hypothetical protein